jgi:hypothetical protein
MKISDLENILLDAWCKETSSEPEKWSKDNPAWGQCAVTSLIVNDYFAGEIVWAEVFADGRRISHYFNLVERREIDLTRKQFPDGTKIPNGVDKKKQFSTTREYILSYQATKDRYELLKRKIDVCIERK